MKIEFFDLSKFYLKRYFFEKGDFMTMKKILKCEEKHGHLE